MGPPTLAALVVNIGFIQLDTNKLIELSLGGQYIANKRIVNFVLYIVAFYEAQLLCITVRFDLIGLFHETVIRMYLMIEMVKERLSLANVRKYNEISVITRSLFGVEILLTAAMLGTAFLLIFIATCLLVVFTKKKNSLLAIPAMVIALCTMELLQVFFYLDVQFINCLSQC